MAPATDVSNTLFGHRKIAKSPITAGKYAFCLFYCAWCITIRSGNAPKLTLPKIIQISINSDLFVFDKFTPALPSIIVPQSGVFFFSFPEGQMKGPLSLGIKAEEERPGLGLDSCPTRR